MGFPALSKTDETRTFLVRFMIVTATKAQTTITSMATAKACGIIARRHHKKLKKAYIFRRGVCDLCAYSILIGRILGGAGGGAGGAGGAAGGGAAGGGAATGGEGAFLTKVTEIEPDADGSRSCSSRGRANSAASILCSLSLSSCARRLSSSPRSA